MLKYLTVLSVYGKIQGKACSLLSPNIANIWIVYLGISFFNDINSFLMIMTLLGNVSSVSESSWLEGDLLLALGCNNFQECIES